MDSSKIAMFFSGRLKVDTFDARLLEFIQRHNIDIFISRNDNENSIDQRLEPYIKIQDISPHDLLTRFSSEQLETLLSHKRPEVNLNNVYSMYYHHNNNLNNIRKYQQTSGVAYDYVIYARYDLVIEGELVLPDPGNHLLIPGGNDHLGINDQWAYGHFETMQKYCSLVDNFYEYATESAEFNPELLLQRHLNQNFETIHRFSLNYSLSNSRHH